MTKRLIEEELPLARVNSESAREKSLRHGHISTMHLWWARRPLAMSRAVVASTLIADPANDDRRRELLDLIADASRFEASNRQDLLRPLVDEIQSTHGGQAPKVLDCFAGGGAIPLEAVRLGCNTVALDLNPVAYLIELCVLDYPQRYGQPDDAGRNRLADDFVKWAQWIRRRADTRLIEAFPTARGQRRPAVYFWARTMRCMNPACGIEMPLVTSRWLARSARRKAWLRFATQGGQVDVHVHSGEPPVGEDPAQATVKSSSASCPACRASFEPKAVRRYAREHGFGNRLLAVLEIDSRVRTYREPSESDLAGPAAARDLLAALPDTDDGMAPIPDEHMVSSQYRRFTNLIYGIDTWAGLFTDRQLLVIGTLADEVRAAYQEMIEQGESPERAVALATYLAFVVDRVADYDSAFASWHITRELIRNTFPQQAIRMAWDYTEINPLQPAPGSFDGAVKWIEKCIRHAAAASGSPAMVLRGDAQDLPFADNTFDAVIVDPPYYDAFQYGDLADFFYVWLKRTVGHLYPEFFATPLTPKNQEIIGTRADKKSREYVSHDEFERRLQNALAEAGG